MADSFFERTEALAKMVGDGDLTGRFVVDGGGRTIPLEVGYWQNHMGRNGYVEINNWSGGENPHAIQNAHEVTYEASLQDIAKTLLEEGPQAGMERHVERVRGEFQRRAPELTGSYKDSYAEFVVDNGVPTHENYGAHYGEEPRA